MLKKLLVCCIVALMMLSLTACSQSYEDDLDDLIQAKYYYNFSEDILLELAPEEFWERWADKEDYEDLDAFFEFLEDESKSKREKYASRDVSYEIIEKTELSDTKLNEIIDSLEDQHNINYGDAEEGYKLEVEVTDKFEGDTDTENYKLIPIKIDGDWYIACYDGYDYKWAIDIVI